MQAVTDIKSQHSNFFLEGYLYVHRTMLKNFEDLVKISNRLDQLVKADVSKLRVWFDFVYAMIEHHHQSEDEIGGYFSFPTINNKYPIPGYEQLVGDHHELVSHMNEIKEKLGQLEVATDEKERSALIVCLQEVCRAAYQSMEEHLEREEDALVPIINKYDKAEQIKAGKMMEADGIKNTPKEHRNLGLAWYVSGLTAEDKENFLKTLPLPPKLLMRFSWNKKYKEFASVVEN